MALPSSPRSRYFGNQSGSSSLASFTTTQPCESRSGSHLNALPMSINSGQSTAEIRLDEQENSPRIQSHHTSKVNTQSQAARCRSLDRNDFFRSKIVDQDSKMLKQDSRLISDSTVNEDSKIFNEDSTINQESKALNHESHRHDIPNNPRSTPERYLTPEENSNTSTHPLTTKRKHFTPSPLALNATSYSPMAAGFARLRYSDDESSTQIKRRSTNDLALKMFR